MSVPAMTWAGRQQIASGSIKGVLTAVAWIAGKEGTARARNPPSLTGLACLRAAFGRHWPSSKSLV